MTSRLIHRTLSFTLAAVITLGLFSGIDHLAGVEGVSGIWAATRGDQVAPAAGKTST